MGNNLTKMAGARPRRSPGRRRRNARLCLHGQSSPNAYKKLPYIMYPPAAPAGCDRGTQRRRRVRGRKPLRLREVLHRLAAGRRSRDPAFDDGGPGDMHAEPTIAAAEAGKNVL